MRHHRAVGAVAFLTVFLSTAACGMSTQSSAVRIDPDRLPRPLASSDPAPSTTVDPASVVDVTLWFVDGEELTPVVESRPVPTAAQLVDLLAVPPPSAIEGGLRSAIPDVGAISVVDVVRGTATVELDPMFDQTRIGDRALAIGQIVLTLVGSPGVDRVAFTRQGNVLSVPLSDGGSTDAPLSREDFAGVIQT